VLSCGYIFTVSCVSWESFFSSTNCRLHHEAATGCVREHILSFLNSLQSQALAAWHLSSSSSNGSWEGSTDSLLLVDVEKLDEKLAISLLLLSTPSSNGLQFTGSASRARWIAMKTSTEEDITLHHGAMSGTEGTSQRLQNLRSPVILCVSSVELLRALYIPHPKPLPRCSTFERS